MCIKPTNRGFKSRGIILMLAISVFAFAVWLKVSPELAPIYRANASQVTKFWVDPTQGSETQAKLAPVVAVLFLFIPLLSLTMAGDWSWQSGFAPRPAARDIFMESRHWFRPPPGSR